MENLGELKIVCDAYLLGVVAFYFLVLFYLGYRGFKKTKNFSSYVIGERKLGAIVGALNVGASDMSSWLLMGLPGAFYLFGLNQIWMVFGLIFGSFLSWSLIAARLRKQSEELGNALTISQFLANRFGDKSGILSITTSLIIIFFFTIYIASGFVGGAKLFAVFFNLSYHGALVLACVAIVCYALIGGFLAVSWADLFQGLLMLFVLLLVPIFVLSEMKIPNFINSLRSASAQHLDPFFEMDFLTILGFLSWGLGYFGQPHIISKFMAIRSEKEISLAKKICLSWMSLSMFGAAAVGLIGFVYFLPQGGIKESETVFVALMAQFFHPIFLGILVAAILSAIMSTINAQIIICASLLAQDFYQKFFQKKAGDLQMLKASRVFVFAVALCSLLIAWNENSSVLNLVARAWAGLGAGIGPIILFAIFSKKTTKLAAIFGVISGALGALIFARLQIFSYEILPAFLLSCLVIFSVSFFAKDLQKNN